MTPPLDLDALAREACGYPYHEPEHGCACARILSALRKVEEQPRRTSDLIGPKLAATINALPDNVRTYIHDLETNADPAGTIQTLAAQTENVAGLTALLVERGEEHSRELRAQAATSHKGGWQQGTQAERERCARIFDRRAEAVGRQFTLPENIRMSEGPDRERAAAIRRGDAE